MIRDKQNNGKATENFVLMGKCYIDSSMSDEDLGMREQEFTLS